MIVQAVLDFVLGALSALFEFLPAFTPPAVAAEWPDWMQYIGNAMRYLSGWVNIGLFLTCVGGALAAYVIALGVRGVLFIYDRIPFKAT